MFFEVFEKLCKDRGITTNKAGTEIGISKGSISYWRKQYKAGIDAKPDTKTAQKFADLFDVSIDYLLGRTSDPTNYDNAELIAGLPLDVLPEFNGDVKKAVAFTRAVDEDAARERAATPKILQLYRQLDEIDRAKAEAYITGLLAADKYSRAQTANKKDA